MAAVILATGILLWYAAGLCCGTLESYRMEVEWPRLHEAIEMSKLALPHTGIDGERGICPQGTTALRDEMLSFTMLEISFFTILLTGLTLFGGLPNSRVKRLILAWILVTGACLSIVLFFLAWVPFGVYENETGRPWAYSAQEVWGMVSSPRWAFFYPPVWLLSRGYALGSIQAYSALVGMLVTALLTAAKQLWLLRRSTLRLIQGQTTN